MSDNYQAVYGAVRSRFQGCDAESAIQSVLRDSFGMASHHMAVVADEYVCAAREQTRPSFLLRLVPEMDGNQWCVFYGEDLQTGIAGFGDTPMQAMREFDKAFGWVG